MKQIRVSTVLGVVGIVLVWVEWLVLLSEKIFFNLDENLQNPRFTKEAWLF